MTKTDKIGKSGFSRRIFTHVSCWALFMTYEVAIVKYLGSKAPLWDFGGFYAIEIALFYFNAHVVFRHVGAKWKGPILFMRLILFIFLELTVYVIMGLMLGYYFSGLLGEHHPVFADETDIVKAAWRGIYFIGLSIAYWFGMETISITEKSNQLRIAQLEAGNAIDRLEKEKLQLQNAYLKAQIDPHFLFNTLGFIYNMTDAASPEAAKGIALLSEVMHYSLGELGEDGKVELTKEIRQIEKYIELNQLRFDYKLHLMIDIKNNSFGGNLRIPPLILLSFVEDIFRHGDLTNPDKPGILYLVTDEERGVHLHIENEKKRAKAVNGHHIGIQNVRSRLDSYYNNRYDLLIMEKDNKFMVNLKIQL